MNRFTVKRDVTFFLYDDLELTEPLEYFLQGYAYGCEDNRGYFEVSKATAEDAGLSIIVDGQEIVIL